MNKEQGKDRLGAVFYVAVSWVIVFILMGLSYSAFDLIGRFIVWAAN